MATTNASRAEFLEAKEPQGPPPVTVLQLLRGFEVDPLERWTWIRATWGEVSRYRFGFNDVFLVATADGARRVLQDNVGNYTKQHMSYRMIRYLVGNGLLTSEGTFWLRQRRLAQPAFHKQRIAAMAAQMVEAAQETAERWDRAVAPGGPVSMVTEMSRLTLRVVGDALFGTGLAAKANPIGEAWDTLNEQVVDRFNRMWLVPPVLPTRYDRQFRAARRTLFRVVDEVIAHKRAQPGEGNDLLSMLMHARDEETGEQMNDAQLRDEVATMVLAGHETTSMTLCWTWALLDQHPNVRERLIEELRKVLGDRPPSFEDLPRLRYTRAVIDEALRLYPPAWILNRRISDDDVVAGYRLHRGGVALISPLLMHRIPEYWDRPDDFMPERWSDAQAELRRPRFAYMPFSGGPRQCIGNTFALTEAVLVLAVLARRFAPRLAPGYRLVPEYLITLRPAGGLPMHLDRVPAPSVRAVAP